MAIEKNPQKKYKNTLIKIRTSRIFWVIVVFFTASIFRISNLNLIEFKGDEQQTVNTVVQFYQKPQFPQTGMFASNGLHNFPLFNYVMISTGLFSKNPEYLSFIIAQINVYMIVFFFLIADKFYGRRTAIFSSLILALSPWAILFSRKIWEQDLIPLFLIPFLYFFHQLILDKKKSAIVPICIFLALLIQIHGSGIYFTFAIILTVMILKTKFNKKLALLGLLLGFLPAIPYIVFQLSSTHFCPDCKALQSFMHETKSFDTTNFIKPLQIISSSSFNQILGDSYLNFFQSSPIVLVAELTFPLEVFFLTYASYFILKYEKKYLFLPILCVLLPLLYYITSISALMHYFIVLLPILALLYGLFFTQALKQIKKPYQQKLLVMLFILLLIVKVIFEINFNHFLYVTKVIKGDYGTIYSKTQSPNKK